MPVELSDRTGRSEHASSGRLAACARHLLELLGCGADELDVVLVEDEEIRRFNREYRSLDRATDVLSFPQIDPTLAVGDVGFDTGSGDQAPGPPELLGDVVISVETAARQAQAGGWTLEEELARLLLHGVLHLLGFDHEAGGEQAAVMKAQERRLSAALEAGGFPCAREEPA
jgi:probable rRNA maturation factor